MLRPILTQGTVSGSARALGYLHPIQQVLLIDSFFQISRAPPVVYLSCPPCHPQIPGHSGPRYTPSQDEATSHEITDTKPPALPAPLQLAPSVWWPDPAWADTAKCAKGKKWRGLSPSDSKEFNDIMAWELQHKTGRATNETYNIKPPSCHFYSNSKTLYWIYELHNDYEECKLN